ncbi:MAG TPA: hypothetical protein VGF59_18735, partial [Bryobacteraceae bacterium]
MRAPLLFTLAIACITPIRAAVFDLALDFSNIANPNGVWSYRAADGTLFGVNNAITAGDWGPDFSGAQTRWNSGGMTGIAESTGNTSMDFPAGSVGGFSGFMVQFTMPFAGTANIDEFLWMMRDLGRTQDVAIKLVSVPFTSTNSIFSCGVGTSSLSLFEFFSVTGLL